MRILTSRSSIVRGYPTVEVNDGCFIYLGGQYKQTIDDVLGRILEDGYKESDIVEIKDDYYIYRFNGETWWKECLIDGKSE